MKFIFLACATLLLAELNAQSSAGDDFRIAAASNAIKPGSHKYLQYMEQKNGLIFFQSILTRKVEKHQYEGKSCWLITQNYQSATSIDNDSSICDEQTLRPRAYYTHIRSEGYREKIYFNEKTIDNQVYYKDSSAKFEKENKDFYNGVATEELIAAYPLKPNARFVIKNVNPGKNYAEFSTEVKVLGQEDIELPGIGKLACWKLTTSSNGATATEWYTVKGKVQVKKRFDLGGGRVFYRVMMATS